MLSEPELPGSSMTALLRSADESAEHFHASSEDLWSFFSATHPLSPGFFLCTAPSSVSLAVRSERLNKEVLAWDKAQPGDC